MKNKLNFRALLMVRCNKKYRLTYIPRRTDYRKTRLRLLCIWYYINTLLRYKTVTCVSSSALQTRSANTHAYGSAGKTEKLAVPFPQLILNSQIERVY